MRACSSFLRYLVFVPLFVALCMVLSAERAQAQGIGRGPLPAAAPSAQPFAADDFEIQVWRTYVGVWASGKADFVIEYTIRNSGSSALTQDEFSFGFGADQTLYTDILAWDSLGELPSTRSAIDGGVLVTIQFRHAVQPGQEYTYFLAISIRDAIGGTGDDRELSWYVNAASNLRELLVGITVPLNATINTVTPTPTTRRNNYLEWRATNLEPGTVLTPYIQFRLSSSLVAPLFYQTDSQWAGEPYYSAPGKTIGLVGCNLTSIAMITRYYGDFHGSTATINPLDYNTWLKGKGLTNDAAVQTSVTAYAKAKGFKLYTPRDYITGPDDAQLDEYLRSGNPVELKVSSAQSSTGIHFVVATGITYVGGVKTYSINDPIFGQTTLKEKYNNRYESMTKFAATAVNVRQLVAAAGVPKTLPLKAGRGTLVEAQFELIVTDPLGRKTGFDPETGIAYDDIPDASYVTQAIAAADGSGVAFEEKFVVMSNPVDGAYTVEVMGTGSGDYAMDVAGISWDGELSVLNFSGTVAAGSVETQSISYNSAVGIPTAVTFLPFIGR